MLDQFLLSFIMSVIFSTMLVIRSFVGSPTLSMADTTCIIVPGGMAIIYFAVLASEQILLFLLSM